MFDINEDTEAIFTPLLEVKVLMGTVRRNRNRISPSCTVGYKTLPG
jgi:hypothetical protein